MQNNRIKRTFFYLRSIGCRQAGVRVNGYRINDRLFKGQKDERSCRKRCQSRQKVRGKFSPW